jgi:undecaprenyl-diphosphatase
MELIHIIVLSVIQGITEFLPVSSSGHLILLPLVMKWNDQGLLIDVAGHLGTLIAVTAYFKGDLKSLFLEFVQGFASGRLPRRCLMLFVASLPIFVVGYFLKPYLAYLRSPMVIGMAGIVFGSLMGVVDYIRPKTRKLIHMTYLHGFFIGFGQIFALIPGASRSGTTITVSRWLGYARDEALTFTFLLSFPITFAAVSLSFFDAWKEGVDLAQASLLIVTGLSALVGFMVLSLVMHMSRIMTFIPFAIYRVILGGVVLLLSWFHLI